MPTLYDIERFSQRTHAEKLAIRHALRAKQLNGGRWNGRWSPAQWERLLEEYDYCCACCHRRLPADKLTPDHRIPLVRGGRNAIANLLPACLSCNSQKGARTETEYRAYLAEKETLMNRRLADIAVTTLDLNDTTRSLFAVLDDPTKANSQDYFTRRLEALTERYEWLVEQVVRTKKPKATVLH